jgi:DNA-binding MarR family transcriptional regulator
MNQSLMKGRRTAPAGSRTDHGNMATHVSALEGAGYVDVQKDFIGKKPRTRIALTAAGRKAFAAHVSYLRNLLENE